MMATRHTVVESALGELTLAAHGESLTGVYFPHHWYRPSADTLGRRVVAASDELLNAASTQLTEFLAGERTTFQLPISLRGDPLQQRVWQLIRDIPYGDTVTYGELAATLHDGSTARDIGAAVGRNPLSIVVPCHRVVGKNGRLTGYAGGLKRKQFLLDLEEPAHARAARLF
jgi:methylated-DNA-[protein]-cysteine S-methyltransferase